MSSTSTFKIWLAVSILTFSLAAYGAEAGLPIRILTHNIRYATTHPTNGEKPWSERKHLLLNELHYHTRHNAESFICLQEVLHEQVVDILGGLNQDSSSSFSSSPSPKLRTQDRPLDQYRILMPQNPTRKDEWTYIGVGRDDGKQAGEYSPIFYRPAIWELVDWKTLWLSETPHVPGSKSWDAAQTRIVTVGEFEHRKTGQMVVGLCTHWDDQGVIARRESAKIILKELESGIQDMEEWEVTPFFLAGDLNSPAEEEGYQILNAPDSVVQDVKTMEPKWRYGDNSTFTGFRDEDLKVIDFVFVGPKEGGRWGVEGYAVLPNGFEDGVKSSDHRAVVADLVLREAGD